VGTTKRMVGRLRKLFGVNRVGTRLTAGFLAVALLIALVGWVAIREQYNASARAARIEAQHVAEQIAHFVSHADPNRNQLYRDPEALQRYVSDIHRDQNRDIEIIGPNRTILADATGSHPGQVFTLDSGGEVTKTLRDGQPHTFTESGPDFPKPIQLVAVPIRDAQTQNIVGAVLLEYTPIYQTLVEASAPTRRIIVGVSISGTFVALALGFFMSRGIVRDLRRLTETAEQLAGGDDTARATLGGRGELGDLAVSFNDMADRIAAQKATLTELAGTDPLTGLDNRRAFLNHLRSTLIAPTALLMLDLDHFKAINDTYGHAAGDAALIALARLLQTRLRPQDISARLGGEEFAVILPDTGADHAWQIAERLRTAIAAQTIAYRGATFGLTASIGVVVYPLHAGDVDTLLHVADHALYAAKHAGRDQVSGPPPPSAERVSA